MIVTKQGQTGYRNPLLYQVVVIPTLLYGLWIDTDDIPETSENWNVPIGNVFRKSFVSNGRTENEWMSASANSSNHHQHWSYVNIAPALLDGTHHCWTTSSQNRFCLPQLTASHDSRGGQKSERHLVKANWKECNIKETWMTELPPMVTLIIFQGSSTHYGQTRDKK